VLTISKRLSATVRFDDSTIANRRLPTCAAEEIVADAQRKGDLIGVRMSITDDEGAQDPWTTPSMVLHKRRFQDVRIVTVTGVAFRFP
jgi:hypothetical protein